MNPVGLFQPNGSFIIWDDLGIDIETNYTTEIYKINQKSPYFVFNKNNYSGKLLISDNMMFSNAYKKL